MSSPPETLQPSSDTQEKNDLAEELKAPTDLDDSNTDSEDGALKAQLLQNLHAIREQGLPAPSSKTSILFRALQVRGAHVGVSFQENGWDLLQAPVTLLRKLLSQARDPDRAVIDDFDGCLNDGEMLLVIGRPGSGCSTMLKTLAGLTDGYTGWSGEIKYNGISIDIMKERFRGDIVYNGEDDVHFPHLNVAQTLRFSTETRTPHLQPKGQTRAEEVRQTVDMLAAALGLSHTFLTKVGDDYNAGVSGGERKRVSLAETFSSRASVGYWDNPTRGLDASTSLDFIKALRTFTNLMRNTAVVALYQAGENITMEFDKVTVLYSGRQIFFGTLSDARKHFEDLGFLINPLQSTADYLTAITDPSARRVKEGFEGRSPREPTEFVREWKRSTYYTLLQNDMQKYDKNFMQTENQLHDYEEWQKSLMSKHQQARSSYILDLPMQMRANVKRSYQRIIGDRAFLFAGVFSSVFTSVIFGSVFYNTPTTTTGFFSRGGVLYFSVLFNALQTIAEIGIQYAQRPIVQKHKLRSMYHPFVDSLSSIFIDWPIKFFRVLVFDIILYFMGNLKREAGAFFVFLLVTLLTTYTMAGFFRTVAAATKRPEIATSVAGISVLAMAIYTGYVIPVPSMHPWFKWIRYINPVAYGFEALVANEFHARKGECANLVPSGPGYEDVSIENQVCPVTGSLPGQVFVSGDRYIAASFEYYYSHLWRNVAILIGFIIFFVFTYALATEYNPPAPDKGDVLIFRKGHVPTSHKKRRSMNQDPEDTETENAMPPLATLTNVSRIDGFKSSNTTFTWENICYDISIANGENRRLLNQVTGYVKAGTLTALMGASGAGKTTLLNVLAQRAKDGIVSGDILVNGAPPRQSFQRQIGYVQQQDLHLPRATVREALQFSAKLRQQKEIPLDEKFSYVEKIIATLEMEEYADAVIGTIGNGLNAEQRKCLTIAVELVAQPAVLLFLDEPTSGLDSQSAWSIIRLLKKLANSGQAVLCTIHQPSSILFEQFDRLLLLGNGGATTYFGEIGMGSSKVLKYFEKQGAHKLPSNANPAEYILDVLSAGSSARFERKWNDIWARSKDHQELGEEINSLVESIRGDQEVPESISGGKFASSWLTQYIAVQHRLIQDLWRDPTYLASRLSLNVVAGLFIGFTFYKESNSVQDSQNKLFSVFMSLILAVPQINQLQPRWANSSTLFLLREKPSKIYHWSALVLSNIIAEIPLNLFCGTLFFVPWYFGIGFRNDWTDANPRGIYMWLMVMIFQFWWSSYGMAIAAVTPNPQTASALAVVFVLFCTLFSGVLQPYRALVKFWHWMYYVSPYTWVVSGLLGNTLYGTSIFCTETEINIFTPPSNQTCGEYAGAFTRISGQILNPSAMSGCEYCRYATADQYLATVNITGSVRWRNMGFVAVYVVFNFALVFAAYYLTKIRHFKRSKRASFKDSHSP